MKILYGVGVGPGDPELLTLKAVRCIRDAQHIFIPRTKPDEPGMAETIIREYLHDKHVVTCHVPMGADNTERYHQIAYTIDATLNDSESGAFITLGDPLVYSTYIYTMHAVNTLGIETRTIPGISSFTAATSALGMPIAVKDEQVYLTDGHLDEAILHSVQTVCVLKPYRDKAATLEKLEKYGFQYTYITHCSLPQEAVLREKEAILHEHEYMGLIIAKKL